MDALNLELAKLRRDANLSQSIEDVDKIIEHLERARESIVQGTKFLGEPTELQLPHRTTPFHDSSTNSPPDPNSASITLTKLQNPIKNGFDRVQEDLRKVYHGHAKYGKALNTVCTMEPLSGSERC